MTFRVHVIPISDEIVHSATGLLCDCDPLFSPDGNVIHNALDCREIPERVTGEQCSDGWILVKELI